MKRLFKGLIAAAVVLTLSLTFAIAACGNSDEPSSTLTPDDPTVTPSDSYTVTFIISDSDTETVTVESGATVSQPEDPTSSSGAVFSGWYSDSSYTTSFDFSTEITSDTTIYAGWIEKREGYNLITYMWNYGEEGVYKVVEVENNKQVEVDTSATRDGYYLRGWYTEADCENEFKGGSASGRVTTDLTLYALWYAGTTFEAEYTDLYKEDGYTGRDFHGYSNNQQGVNAVMVSEDASNGYYISGYYQSNEYLEFVITSDTAVDDAALYLTAAMEYGWDVGASTTSLSNSDFTITVNGETVKYSDMVFDMSSVAKSFDISPFTTFYLGTISLNEGENVIKLEMTNEIKGQGGTQDGKGCLVDCITIYTNATLSWTPETDNIED